MFNDDDLTTNYTEVSDRIKSGRLGRQRRNSHLDDPATVPFLKSKGIIDDERAAHNRLEMTKAAVRNGIIPSIDKQVADIRAKAAQLKRQETANQLEGEMYRAGERLLAAARLAGAKARREQQAKADAASTWLRDTTAELARLAREVGR